MGRVLKPTRFGAALEDLFYPSDLMHYCQAVGSVSDKEAYRTWNMGQGMVLITPEPDAVIQGIQAHGIEAKVVGEVTRTPGIRIKSRGYYDEGKELVF